MFVVGVMLAHLGFWLDHVDGQVARWRGTVEPGRRLPRLLDAPRRQSRGWLRAGVTAWRSRPAMSGGDRRIRDRGWAGTVLSLHNDCRYKAFFQRLKSAKGSYRVDGGAAADRTRPDSWPSRGRAALTWPAFKACETHVITLAGWTGLAGNRARRRGFFSGRRSCLHGRARTLLAIGRAARSVSGRTAESEFARWFQRFEGMVPASRTRPPGHGDRGGLSSKLSPRLFRTLITATINTRSRQARQCRGEGQPAMTSSGHHRLAALSPPTPQGRGLGIGVVGAGFIVRDCHLPPIADAGFRVVGIDARGRSKRHGQGGGCGDSQSLRHSMQMLDDPAVEVVDVAVPPSEQPKSSTG